MRALINLNTDGKSRAQSLAEQSGSHLVGSFDGAREPRHHCYIAHVGDRFNDNFNSVDLPFPF